MPDCPHMNFKAAVRVNRIQKSALEPETIIAYAADIKVCCLECGQPFEFVGLPMGCSPYRPTASMDGQELHAPMAIPGTRPPDGMPGFSVRHQPLSTNGEVVNQ